VEVLETNVQYSVESRNSTVKWPIALRNLKMLDFLTEARRSPPRWCACQTIRQSDTLSDLVEIILPRPGLAVSIRGLT